MEINPVALGFLAAAIAKADLQEIDDDREFHEGALFALASAMRDEIFACLSAAYGDLPALFSRMSRTNQPLADDDNDPREFEPTGRNAAAFEYVSNGFRL